MIRELRSGGEAVVAAVGAQPSQHRGRGRRSAHVARHAGPSALVPVGRAAPRRPLLPGRARRRAAGVTPRAPCPQARRVAKSTAGTDHVPRSSVSRATPRYCQCAGSRLASTNAVSAGRVPSTSLVVGRARSQALPRSAHHTDGVLAGAYGPSAAAHVPSLQTVARIPAPSPAARSAAPNPRSSAACVDACSCRAAAARDSQAASNEPPSCCNWGGGSLAHPLEVSYTADITSSTPKPVMFRRVAL
jgi:hypothetical protein